MKLAFLIIMVSKMISNTIDMDTLEKVKDECKRRGIPVESTGMVVDIISYIPILNVLASYISNKNLDINVLNVGLSLGMNNNVEFYIGYWEDGKQVKLHFHITEDDELVIDELSSKKILALTEAEQYSLLACLLLNYYYGDKSKLIYSDNIGLAYDKELIEQLTGYYESSKENLTRTRENSQTTLQ